MRKREGYTFNFDQGHQLYRFTSTGPKGDIQKIVTISPAYGPAWNFAFGDAVGDGGDFDDEVISNNGDIRLVLQTLANIIYDFLGKHPERYLLIFPVDQKRQRLYHRIIHRNLGDFGQEVLVYGVLNQIPEILSDVQNKTYDYFIVSKELITFE